MIDRKHSSSRSKQLVRKKRRKGKKPGIEIVHWVLDNAMEKEEAGALWKRLVDVASAGDGEIPRAHIVAVCRCKQHFFTTKEHFNPTATPKEPRPPSECFRCRQKRLTPARAAQATERKRIREQDESDQGSQADKRAKPVLSPPPLPYSSSPAPMVSTYKGFLDDSSKDMLGKQAGGEDDGSGTSMVLTPPMTPDMTPEELCSVVKDFGGAAGMYDELVQPNEAGLRSNAAFDGNRIPPHVSELLQRHSDQPPMTQMEHLSFVKLARGAPDILDVEAYEAGLISNATVDRNRIPRHASGFMLMPPHAPPSIAGPRACGVRAPSVVSPSGHGTSARSHPFTALSFAYAPPPNRRWHQANP
jgi:hypothetical protein